MAYHWEDREKLKTCIFKEGMIGHVLWFLGIIFAVLGIIGDAANINLGLTSMSWFLLAIVAFVAGIIPFIELAIAWYLKSTETKKEE